MLGYRRRPRPGPRPGVRTVRRYARSVSGQESHALRRNWITVRDVINQLANIEGAVHRDEAKDARERALREMAKFYNHSGLPGAVNQVKLIGRITVRGLSPLRDAITADVQH